MLTALVSRIELRHRNRTQQLFSVSSATAKGQVRDAVLEERGAKNVIKECCKAGIAGHPD